MAPLAGHATPQHARHAAVRPLSIAIAQPPADAQALACQLDRSHAHCTTFKRQ
jgi:hypothetical protein